MPRKNHHRESWGIIRGLTAKSELPWCIIGDFNDLLYADEKRGGRDHPQNLMIGFGKTIRECNLMDFIPIGSSASIRGSSI